MSQIWRDRAGVCAEHSDSFGAINHRAAANCDYAVAVLITIDRKTILNGSRRGVFWDFSENGVVRRAGQGDTGLIKNANFNQICICDKQWPL